MNQPPNEQLKRLEQVTSPPHQEPPILDETTAGLRESWKGLAILLNASDKEINKNPLPTFAVPARRSRVWIFASVSAVSAMILVAIGWKYLPRQSPTKVTALPAAATNTNQGKAPQETQMPRIVPTPKPVLPPLAVVDESVKANIAWDDPLDEEIAAAQNELVRAKAGSSWADGPFRILSWRMEQMDLELNDEAL